ncbi:MAG: hypothetical protein R3C45_19280 [Phycisphaerales bacterium]
MLKPLADHISCFCIILLAMIYPGCATRNNLSSTDSPKSDTAAALYYTMCIKPDVDLKSRCDAASALATHPQGGPWIILRLADDDVSYRYTGPVFNENVIKMKLAVTKTYENLITSSMIESLAESPDPAILWALTFRLHDKGVGLYGETVVDPESGGEAMVEYITKPIADSARSVLAKTIGEDFGYDQRQWRTVIGQMIEAE